MAYYAVLAAKGFLPADLLPASARTTRRSGYHPDRTLVPGVEISSGSLGHGLPLAVGMALGLRAQGPAGPRVLVLVGDAELDEGSNHEAIEFAGAAGLDALHVVVVDNASASYGWPGGVGARFAAEGWSAPRPSTAATTTRWTAAFTAPHPGPAARRRGRGRRARRTSLSAPAAASPPAPSAGPYAVGDCDGHHA